MKANRILAVITMILGLSAPGFSQEVTLPTMEVIMAAALDYSPLVKTQAVTIKKQEAEMKRNGKLWLQTLQFQVGTQYNNFFSNENVSIPAYGAQTGLIVRVSLYDLLSRKNVMDRSRYEVEEARLRTDQQRVVIRQMVIAAYQQASLNLELLRITNDRVLAASSHQTLAEQEFKSGDILLSELSRVTQIVGQARMEQAKAKADFYEAYYQLEALVGKPLNEL